MVYDGTVQELNDNGCRMYVWCKSAKFMHIRAYITPRGTCEALLRLNEDSGSLYANRRSANGGADSTAVSQTSIDLCSGTFSTPQQFDIYIYDTINNEKMVQMQRVDQSTAGAANAPGRTEFMAKYVPATATDTITKVSLINTQSTGEFAAGSRLTVMAQQ